MIHYANSACANDLSLCLFFKQKSVYELGISDWSSDVCASDLAISCAMARTRARSRRLTGSSGGAGQVSSRYSMIASDCRNTRLPCINIGTRDCGLSWLNSGLNCSPPSRTRRSEEQTSELQSLMRLSYAVFCFKKKHNHN